MRPEETDNLEPSKFEGKDRNEIIESYLALEQEKSRLGNELGSVRKNYDILVQDKILNPKVTTTPDKREPVEVSATEFFENPTKATRKVVIDAVEEKLSEVEQKLEELTTISIQDKFAEKHPDADDILQNKQEELRQHVLDSPWLGQYVDPALAGDLRAVDFILSSYKKELATVASAIESKQTEVKGKRTKQLKDAKTISSGGGETTEERFSREDIIKMKQYRPREYANPEFQKRLLEAYRDNRVDP